MGIFRSYELFFDEPIQDKKTRHLGWGVYLGGYLARPIVKLMYRYKMVGAQNIPAPMQPPVIFAANHVSFGDPAVLWVATYPRITRFLARKTLFAKPFIRSVFARVGTFPVDPDSADRKAIKRAVACLKRGECVGIFPEGTRMNDSEKEYRPHAGLALIAQMSGAKIVPVGISGTEKIMPPGARLPRFPKVTISFGEAIDPEDFSELPKPERTAAVLDAVMKRIFELRDAAH